MLISVSVVNQGAMASGGENGRRKEKRKENPGYFMWENKRRRNYSSKNKKNGLMVASPTQRSKNMCPKIESKKKQISPFPLLSDQKKKNQISARLLSPPIGALEARVKRWVHVFDIISASFSTKSHRCPLPDFWAACKGAIRDSTHRRPTHASPKTKMFLFRCLLLGNCRYVVGIIPIV